MEKVYEKRWIVSRLTTETRNKPYHQHLTRDNAEKEAIRLAMDSPGIEFGVFEIVKVVIVPLNVQEYRIKDSWDS